MVRNRGHSSIRCLIGLHRWRVETDRDGPVYESCTDCEKSRLSDRFIGRRPKYPGK
jgi:hypothetical protein